MRSSGSWNDLKDWTKVRLRLALAAYLAADPQIADLDHIIRIKDKVNVRPAKRLLLQYERLAMISHYKKASARQS
jgi:hypothetical protein